MIIGLAGKKQVGKSTAAAHLVEHGFYRMSYAQPIKKMATTLLHGLGYSSEQISYFEEHKEATLPLLGCSMRHLLQTLGTDWGRQLIHPDIWIIAVNARIDELSLGGLGGLHIVLEDVRFENEADSIRKRGGRIIHIIRNTGLSDEHCSESGVEIKYGDVLVNNSGNRDAFRRAIVSATGLIDTVQ